MNSLLHRIPNYKGTICIAFQITLHIALTLPFGVGGCKYYKTNYICFFEQLQSKILPSSSKVTSKCDTQLSTLFHTQGTFSNP